MKANPAIKLVIRNSWLLGLAIFFGGESASPSSVSAFVIISNAGKPAHWTNGVVRYRFNTTTSGFFTGGHDASGTATDEFNPIRESFATWANVPGLNLTIQE